MPATTAKQVPYPIGSDAAATLDTIVQSLAEWIDANPGIAPMTTTARDALSGAARWIGRVIYNTTTSELDRWNGTIWTPVVRVGSSQLLALAVVTAAIADAAVTTAKLADGSVTAAKHADGSVTTAKLADANVTTAKIADANVTAAKIADGNVTGAKLANDSVTDAKIGFPATTAFVIGSLTCYLHRMGNSVFMAYTGGAAGVGTYANVVPAGWRPVANVGLDCGQFSSLAVVDANGTITIIGGSAFVSGAWSTV